MLVSEGEEEQAENQLKKVENKQARKRERGRWKLQGEGSSEIEEIIKVEYSQEETVASAEEKKASTIGDEEPEME